MLRGRFVTYLTLSALAIGQPILDLYGNNLTIFSAAKFNRFSVVLFAVIIVLLPASIAALIERFSRLFGTAVSNSVHLVLVGVFATMFFGAVLNTVHVSNDFVVYPLALVLAMVLCRLYDISRGLQQWLSLLSVVSLASVGLFAVQAQPILLSISADLADITVEHPEIPVLEIILDELPLYSLLGVDGNINAERFPGFAELQKSSTWYRNNASVSNFTHQAVPGILASKTPRKNDEPFLWTHPQNIFTLLGKSLDIDGIEPVTSMCPTSVCTQTPELKTAFNLDRFKKFFHDVFVVYGQRVLPNRTAQHLPATNHGWGGFDAVASRFVGQLKQGPLAQLGSITTAVDRLVQAPGPSVQVVHALMPHAPWYLTPDERITQKPVDNSTDNPPNNDATRDNYQRYLNQMVATDATILRAINTLKEKGFWDKMLLVVTADHGISFVPGQAQRQSTLEDMDLVNDIYRVATFVKYPDQQKATISDCATSNLDLLPTIADVLGVMSEWKFSGSSLKSSCPRRSTRPIESATGQFGSLDTGFDDLLTRVQYYSDVVTNIGGARRIAAVGATSDLIGFPAPRPTGPSVVARWVLNRPDEFSVSKPERGSFTPVTVQGGVLLNEPLPEGSEGILVVDGVAAGVVGEFGNGSVYFGFLSVIDYSLLTSGKHKVEMLVYNGETGVITTAGSPSPNGAITSE
ncbi:MAG: hypothetical protein EXQ64_00050 [Ilumatobacteraceae bacterium]|nr:hypothetical protein [Ilumatobacteraceae bacterium]